MTIKTIWAAIREAAIKWIAAGVVALMAGGIYVARDWFAAFVALPVDLPRGLVALEERFDAAQLHNDALFRAIRDDIDALRQPSDIFEVAASSGPVDGYCIANQPCTIRLLARRNREGLACRIEPGETRYFFVDLADDVRRREVRRIDNPVPRNIGLDWTPITMTVDTPGDFAAAEAFFFVAIYSGCLGDEDDTQIAEASALIPAEIRPGN